MNGHESTGSDEASGAGSASGHERRGIALVTAQGAWDTDEDALPLVDALARRSVAAEPALWDDPDVDWSQYDLVVLRSPWDYTERVEEFLVWADRVSAVTPLANPVEVLRWNTDKHYLGELARRGVSVVPTSFVPATNHEHQDLVSLLPTEGRFVLKPTISSGSRNTARYHAGDHENAAVQLRRLLGEGRDVMIQPYLESVEDHGETGMLFFAGQFSHGFRKGALLRGGPAQVHGLYAHEQIDPRQPGTAELDLAHSVLEAVVARFGHTPLYARVDVLNDVDRVPMLLELELIEPSYFLRTDPGSADRAAAAYAAALDRARDDPDAPK